MIEVHFLIPTKNNSGKRFSVTKKETVQATLLELFKGFTGPTRSVDGGWKAETGIEYRDSNVSYLVFVPGLIAPAAQILKAVEFAKVNFDQLAITVRYLGHAEIL